jgi:hypothetical protein
MMFICPSGCPDLIPTRDTTEYWDAEAKVWIPNDPGNDDPPYCPNCSAILYIIENTGG